MAKRRIKLKMRFQDQTKDKIQNQMQDQIQDQIRQGCKAVCSGIIVIGDFAGMFASLLCRGRGGCNLRISDQRAVC